MAKSQKVTQDQQKKGSATKVATPPKAVKPQKPHGPVPDYKHQKNASKPELVSDNMSNLFRGFCGSYDIGNGVCVTVRKINPEKDVRAVFMHSAPKDNVLSCACNDVYVLVSQLHRHHFESGLAEGSNKRAVQELFFNILNATLIAERVKEPPHVRVVKQVQSPVHVVKTEQKAMAHADEATLSVILAGTQGKYVLGKGENRIVLKVHEIHPRRLGKGHKTAVLAVEVMSVNPEHPLLGTVAKGTFVPHDLLSNGKMLNHTGCQALLAFLKPQ